MAGLALHLPDIVDNPTLAGTTLVPSEPCELGYLGSAGPTRLRMPTHQSLPRKSVHADESVEQSKLI